MMRHRGLAGAVLVLVLGFVLVPASAGPPPSINETTIFFGGSNGVGTTTASVYSVALGDLDDDGVLDIVSGSLSSEDYEVIAWQGDDTPFSEPWPQHDVGATAASVYSVALGDLDKDNDLDIVSGSWAGEGSEVVAWENDASPFLGLWSQHDVGPSTSNVYSVSLGDLNGDTCLDIVSGSDSGENYELIAWQNDCTPFDGPWTQNDVGASSTISSVALGDLDGDDKLDIVSGSYSGEDYEVIAWRNDGTPFTGFWMQYDVGASTDSVRVVAVGDLDNDNDLDIVSGSNSAEDFELIAWQNDGTPFGEPWAPNDVGASSTINSLALGDLDGDGDLDIVTGSNSAEEVEVVAWRNDGTPFQDLWERIDIGDSLDTVRSVALGDLDNDGDLDVASGSSYRADHELIVWKNIGLSRFYLPIIVKNTVF